MTAAGTLVASHNQPVDASWADSMAMFPEEVEAIKERMDLARMIAGIQ